MAEISVDDIVGKRDLTLTLTPAEAQEILNDLYPVFVGGTPSHLSYGTRLFRAGLVAIADQRNYGGH